MAQRLSEGGLFKLEAFANTESLRNALRAGRIDFALTDTSFAQSAQLDTRLPDGKDQLLYKEFGPEDMPRSGEVEVAQNYAIAVRRGEIELLGAINETLAKAKMDGELANLFAAASKAYEEAHNYPAGNRSLGERPWECAGQVAERVGLPSPN
ncbi:MAG TPA: transporter substrate-binding domain-containing protein [Methyloceanibacter sp.]|nr:transporter substrate-binding domain-containing protein [Methyloceanibacter sp.]